MRFKRYLTEKKVQMTGDQYKDYFLKQLNKWDTDLSKMTKAYKALKTIDKLELFEERPDGSYGFKKGFEKHPVMKQFAKLKSYFMTFRKNFENWIYNKVLDPKTFGEKNESIWQEEVRKTAWKFYQDVLPFKLFPQDYNNEMDKHINAPWMLDVKRSTNILRYQKSWREFKKSFEEMVEYQSDLLNIAEDEQIQISGVNITIKNKRSREDDKYIKKFIPHLRQAVNAIKKEGLSKAIRGFKIEYNFNPATVSGLGNKGALTAGAYDKTTDTLYIFPLNITKITDSTLIHEIGHRYWFRNIPKQAQKEWEEKISDNKITITQDHIDKFFDKFYKPEGFTGFPMRKEMKQEVEKMEDSELKIAFRYLANNTPMFDTENREQEYREFLKKRAKGEEIPLEWISEYGRTNPAEAFAEAFKIWVGGQKGRLGVWTRAFFKKIVESGGSSIKEEKQIIDKYLKKRNY